MSCDGDKRINPFLEKHAVRNNCNSRRNRNEANDSPEYDDKMTESYSEISLQSNFANSYQSNPSDSAESQQAAEGGSLAHFNRPDCLMNDKSFPYNLEGTISKDGDLTNFVAENLEFKIKLSSPVTKKDIGGLYLRHNSTPSTSGLNSQQFIASQQQPLVDSNVLNDIEIEAQYLAASVDNLTENLCNLLHSISSITADNVEIHKNAVNKLTDSMDANIKSMYTIMAKTEEISKAMKPTEQLANRIREIKRLVDMLESNL